MTFIAGILTVLLVINCILLILLVLVQLPKKDAGAGMAFGGGAADALFGAGSGNVLTKITKWATGIFFAMALLLGILNQSVYHSSSSALDLIEKNQSRPLPAAQPGTTTPVTTPTTPASSSTPAIPAGTPPAAPQPTN
jgi:preprotein translocase subunit SecG